MAAVAALVLALIHLHAGKLRSLEGIPRSRWLSLAGGVSVSYVFLHLLPELARGQEALRQEGGMLAGILEQQTYLVSLFGLTVFYGLERLARSDRRREDQAEMAVFRIHVGSFALYNALVGYLLLHLERETPRELILFAVAIALHFVVNDSALRDHHGERYQRVGRWLLAAAVLVGAALGFAGEISQAAVALITAFLGGGIILNVLKEELPDERESRIGSFALGAALYAVLLLAL